METVYKAASAVLMAESSSDYNGSRGKNLAEFNKLVRERRTKAIQ